jgi:hypothetical protein
VAPFAFVSQNSTKTPGIVPSSRGLINKRTAVAVLANGIGIRCYTSTNASNTLTNSETLKQALNETGMDAFQKSWEKWVLTLTFP